MNNDALKIIAVSIAAAVLMGTFGTQGFRAEVPTTWDETEMERFELPLASPEFSPKHVSAAYYDALPVRPIYKSYPVYHPEHEPPDYLASLAEMEPEIVFDVSGLHTEADWVAAGALVFAAPITYAPIGMRLEDVRDPEWYRQVEIPVTSDGIMPFASYVVREKGNVELGQLGCSACHSRVLDDGSLVLGGPGNFNFDPSWARMFRSNPRLASFAPALVENLVAAPWIDATLLDTPPERVLDQVAAIPTGAILRQGTSLSHPTKIPDLIGLRDRLYLDATGFVVQRSVGDVMRYAAVNQTLDMLATYGSYIPSARDGETLPPAGEGGFVGTDTRYSDAQLYALGLYLYSLKPPVNPNPVDAVSARGENVFAREGCALCHTPPLYTNNMLIPAPAFTPPPEHYERYDILDVELGTDPTNALETRRGTGYYKVPSLKGVWYRGAFQHNARARSLEEWFDPARVEPDYEPSPIAGHRFGLALTPEERTALIAFLRTL